MTTTDPDAAPPTPRSSRVPRPPAALVRRTRRALPALAVLTLTSLVVAGLAVVPARTYLSQRTEAAEAEQELARLRAEVAELDAELRLLETDEAVERIAREHYDLVYPGEESYRILPAAGS